MKTIFIDSERRWRNGWKALGSIALSVAFAAAFLFLQRQLPLVWRQVLPSPLCAFFGVLISSWLSLRLEGERLSSLGVLPARRTGRDFGFGLVSGVVLVLVVAVLLFALDGFHLVRAEQNGVGVLLKAAWLMLWVALFEETLFHGYAFQRAIRGMGPAWTQLVFAVVFCLAHSYPDMAGGPLAVAMTNTFLAGLLLGLCYLRTGGLALPVGVHLGWNGTLALLGFGVSGEESKGAWTPVFHDLPQWLAGGRYGLEASVISLVVLGLFILALARWKGARQSEVPTSPPAGLVQP
ncbi:MULTISPECIES: CPBP family intramembrane glutamic endopeptidase [Myxococcus]|uniref:CPBP family intramembrane glutamic endopeptidase n=1 Tax=Myxococcus TaxID=32 RepID=UPI0013D665E1|nr:MULTISPECIES: CPBP family intramembrane glutamic endopeptidase [Myxococcus]NVJ24487.1 CPBP family intramembrane metalloprotease [Myxococcus sp. AM011]